ncbi:MAG TPA: ATP-binding protein [Sandaracinaceae bacterium LLY-WYZ-13_1]|nr:ATP-binding protein [Sandaracinaceae bacterium LLY-WYZ-13_1]
MQRADLALFERLTSPVWVYDLERLRPWWANRAALDLWAVSDLETWVERHLETPPSEGARRRLEAYAERFRQGESVTEQWSFYPAGRAPVSALCTCSALSIEDEHGTRVAMLVEARELAAEALLADERRLVEALRHCDEQISLYDLGGRPLLRNPAAERAFGTLEERDHDTLAAIFAEPDDADIARAALESRGRFRREARVHTRAGPAWHQVDLRRVVDPVTGGEAVLVSQHDVGAHREYERQLERARREAERLRERAEAASRAKTAFLAVMSHELRTPMTGVLAAARLLGESALDEDQREVLAMVTDAGRQMVDLIDDVLDLSRVEAGRVSLRLEPASVERIVRETLRALAAAAEQKGLTLACEVADDVPASVVVDPRRLRQVLTNLVANAIKFSDEGPIRVAVDAEPVDEGRAWLRLAVMDRGAGMAPDQARRLFEPFAQGDSSSSRRHGGVGLGLHIVRTLVEVMGGAVDVDSELGRGSTFRVRLPAAIATSEARSEPPPPRRRHLPRRVLVADDNALNRRAFVRILRRWGCRVAEAADGAEALARLDEARFDAILMDVHMPGLDGVAAARAVRERPEPESTTPIVALTADAFFAESDAYREAGFDGFVSKPVDWDRLYATLERLTG